MRLHACIDSIQSHRINLEQIAEIILSTPSLRCVYIVYIAYAMQFTSLKSFIARFVRRFLSIFQCFRGGRIEMKQVKILVVGDEAVGKTSLVERYVKGTFFMNHSPTVINEYSKTTKFHQLHIRDCSALREFESVRCLQYCEVDIVLLCFNLATIGSLDSLKSKWLAEIKQHCPKALRILVGCKNDLDSIINEGTVVQMQDVLKVSKFVKCSAKSNENVDAVFGTAMNAFYQSHSLSMKRNGGKRRK